MCAFGIKLRGSLRFSKVSVIPVIKAIVNYTNDSKADTVSLVTEEFSRDSFQGLIKLYTANETNE